MSSLLEVIAESDASVLNSWATVFRDRESRTSALPESEHARELLVRVRATNKKQRSASAKKAAAVR